MLNPKTTTVCLIEMWISNLMGKDIKEGYVALLDIISESSTSLLENSPAFQEVNPGSPKDESH